MQTKVVKKKRGIFNMTRKELDKIEQEFEQEYNKYMQMQPNKIDLAITKLELAYINYLDATKLNFDFLDAKDYDFSYMLEA